MAKIADIIMYEGDNSTFIWKHWCEDFNALTQLIVHESQEAVFFMNGEALDVFRAGRYTLETQNIPKIGKILNRATGDQTPFHCEVYFINQTVQMDLKWGTDSKISYLEPEFGVPIDIGASGSLNLKVSDGLKLLVKLVGTMNGVAWGDTNQKNFTKTLQSAFRPMISTAVKSHLPSALKDSNISILEVDEHLEELSAVLKAKIIPGFEEYGLTVPNFYLTTVVLPENDKRIGQIRDLHAIALQTRMATAEAQVRTAQALAQAQITAAQREIELEKQATQTEVAKRVAERRVIAAQTEAEAVRQKGFAVAEVARQKGLFDAEVMQAQGVNKKDYLQADVQKAYASGIGQMGSGGGGGGAGGSAMSDIIGLGVGLQAAQAMSGQIGNIFGGMTGAQPVAGGVPVPAQTVKCPKCGADLPANAKYCLTCGEKISSPADDQITCPKCGKSTPKGKFCIECGATLANKCSNCGADVPAGGKFCQQCGNKM